MIIKNIYPESWAFCDNPILVYLDGQDLTYRIKKGDVILFTGHGDGAFTVNIADIVSAAMPTDREMPAETIDDTCIRQRDDLPIAITVEAVDGDGNREQGSVQVWPGGIAMSDYRALRLQEDTAFFHRFTNYSSNFLLTTRTADWILPIRETELEPLAFVLSGARTNTVVIRDELYGEVYHYNIEDNRLTTLDLDNLRRYIFDEEGHLSNVFTIGISIPLPQSTKVVWGVRVVITPAEVSRQRCLVRYVNSLGVYERIDLTGTVTVNTSGQDGEDAIYKHYDEKTDSFLRQRDRQALAQSYTIKTGLLPRWERNALLDMIASDEVWLIMPDGLPLRVIPSVENLTMPRRPEQPESFEVTFTPQEDLLLAPVGNMEGKVYPPQVFNSRFTSVFE